MGFVRPQHKTYEPHVLVPTIVVAPLTEGREPEVLLQWFGDTDLGRLIRHPGTESAKKFLQMQFRFPILVPQNFHIWMGHPERFEVVFIGKVNNWPNWRAVAKFEWEPESWVLWVVSSHYAIRDSENEAQAASFAIPFSVRLGDAEYGVITPKPYSNIEVLRQADRTVRAPVIILDQDDPPPKKLDTLV